MARFERETALKSAEKAIRLGNIDAAITEFLKIVEAQPRDWNSANALGDLYVRSKQVDKGLAQYTRIADHLAAEGFYPKAAALYKKVLKFKPDDEYAMLQSAEISAKQGLLADAKAAFRAVVDARRARGDKKGAAELSIRLGALDPDDLEARLVAARAAADIGDVTTALREFREIALRFESDGNATSAFAAFQAAFDLDPDDAEVRRRLLDGYLAAGDLAQARAVARGPAEFSQIASSLQAAGRTDDMLDVFEHLATLDPANVEPRVALAQAYVAKGDLERARKYLTAEVAGEHAPMWLALAEIELASGHGDEGRLAVTRALELDPATREAAIALGARLAERSADAGYACLNAVAEAALAGNDYAGAAAALQEFVSRVDHHVIALMRLVEICVDGGLEATMHDAQAELADAYLEVGRGLEARIISEDLVAREPWVTANIDRFRRSLVMLGETDPDTIIADRLSGESPFLATDKMDLNEGVFFDDEEPRADGDRREDTVPVDDEEVIDLGAATLDVSQPATRKTTPTSEPARSLDQVFEGMRDEVRREPEEEVAEEQYRLAQTYRELGMLGDAIDALEVAAQSPRQRFDAASLLGTLYLEQDEVDRAIEWFERAAETPAPSPDAARVLRYHLASTLEKAGEPARALAVFRQIESDSRGYRDVAGHIARLSKVKAKG